MNRLKGKTALITGDARGIGRAIAEEYVREGTKVVIADLLEDEAKSLAADLGASARGIWLGVTDRASIPGAVAAAKDAVGGIDILLNNAGIFDMCRLHEITEPMYRRQFDVNVADTIFMSQAYNVDGGNWMN